MKAKDNRGRTFLMIFIEQLNSNFSRPHFVTRGDKVRWEQKVRHYLGFVQKAVKHQVDFDAVDSETGSTVLINALEL